MISLTPSQRSLVLFLSACSYLAWFSGVGERSEAQAISRSETSTLRLSSPPTPPRVTSMIRRDPFSDAPGSNETDSTTAMEAARAERASDDARRVGTGVPVANGDVPDLGGMANVAVDRDTGNAAIALVVRATITGPNPVAYVANGTMMDIVRIGDRLGDRRIVGIDLRGVAFADGSRLDLPGNFEATAAPRAVAGGITIRLEDLRKLLVGTRRESTPLAPPVASEPASVASPTPAPTGTYPTPGPLPTVNQRGIPVGTNPTFDPDGPTPYPQPYPYAPPRRP